MVRLAIDLGTSHTVAVVRRDDQPPRTLLFDGSPALPSGVFAASDGALHTGRDAERLAQGDRKSTRLNSSHGSISYAVFCLKKKKRNTTEYFFHIKNIISRKI